jgi:glycosyltransferase involved in cell wall biosynthesis
MLALTHHVVPFRSRQAVTVHDLRPLYAPDSLAQAVYFRYMLPRALRRCDGVITVSKTTKELLQSEYLLPPDKVHVISNCVDARTFKPLPEVELRDDSDPFLLIVGASWSHKNAEEVLENACAWKHKYRLVIISANAEHRDHLRNLVERVGIADRVDLLPAQGRQKMVSYYQHCAALVYPSKMEGFGIPPLEAMACGRPVILSDIPVFRELYDDVPIYVTLGDKASWSAALASLDDATLISRKVEQGISKAGEFNEERTKAELLKAISSIWSQS